MISRYPKNIDFSDHQFAIQKKILEIPNDTTRAPCFMISSGGPTIDTQVWGPGQLLTVTKRNWDLSNENGEDH